MRAAATLTTAQSPQRSMPDMLQRISGKFHSPRISRLDAERKKTIGFSSRLHNLILFVSNLILFTLSTTDVVKVPIIEHGEGTVFAHLSQSLSFS